MPHLMDFNEFIELSLEDAKQTLSKHGGFITLRGEEPSTDLADLFKVLSTVKAVVIDIAEWISKKHSSFYVTIICEAGEVVVMADWSIYEESKLETFVQKVLKPLSEIKENVSFKGINWGDLKNDEEMLERISDAAFNHIPDQFPKDDTFSKEEVIEKILKKTNLR